MKVATLTALLAATANCSTTCVNSYTVAQYNTCEKLEQHFGVSREVLHKLNSISCKNQLPQGKEVCLGTEAPKPCQRIYTIKEFTTCRKLQEVFNITEEQLVKMNLYLDCSRGTISEGREICVSQEVIKPCQEVYKKPRGTYVDKDENVVDCSFIQKYFGNSLTLESLHAANDNLDCKKKYPTLCLSREKPQPSCKKVYKTHSSSEDEWDIVRLFDISEQQLRRLNTDLALHKIGWNIDQRNELRTGTEVCVSREEPKSTCMNTYTVAEFDTCEKLEIQFDLTRKKLHNLNSRLWCGDKIPQGTKVCVSNEISPSCAKKYAVFEYKTCEQIEKIFEVKHEDFVKMNPNVDCKYQLPEDREVCVQGTNAASI